MTMTRQRVDPTAVEGDENTTAPLAPDIPRRHRRHWAVDIISAIVVVAAVAGLISVVANPAMGWSTITQYFFSPRVLSGLWITLVVTTLSMALAIIIGVIVANMRLARNRILSSIAWAYVWFFRSVPTLLLLILVYNISILYPRIAVGVPFGPELFAVDTVTIINGFVAGVLVFGLQQAAYTAEVVRAATLAVPRGQTEASMAIGMRPMQRLTIVVLPQALRIALPPIANDTINMLKGTSLLAFIAVPDLLYTVQQIYSQNYQVIPMLMVASIWYVILVSALSVGQLLLENYLSTGKVSFGVRTARTRKASAS